MGPGATQRLKPDPAPHRVGAVAAGPFLAARGGLP